jgi:hypothetical protein
LIISERSEDEAAAAGRGSALGTDRAVDPAESFQLADDTCLTGVARSVLGSSRPSSVISLAWGTALDVQFAARGIYR